MQTRHIYTHIVYWYIKSLRIIAQTVIREGIIRDLKCLDGYKEISSENIEECWRFWRWSAGWDGVGGGDEGEDRNRIWYLEVIKSNEWHFQAEALGAELWFAMLSFLFIIRLVTF